MQCSFNRFCFFTASACHTAVIHAVALPCADAHAQSAAFLAERGGERVALAADEDDGLRDVVVGSVDGDGYEVVARGGLRHDEGAVDGAVFIGREAAHAAVGAYRGGGEVDGGGGGEIVHLHRHIRVCE